MQLASTCSLPKQHRLSILLHSPAGRRMKKPTDKQPHPAGQLLWLV